MQLTVAAWDDRIFQVELDDGETLSTLQAILEAESNTPAAQQQLVHNGRPLPASATGQTLSSLGIANGDMLMLMPKQAAATPQQQQQQRQPQANPNMALAEDGSARAPAAFIQTVKASPDTLAQIAASNPPLAAAIRNEDIAALQVGIQFCSVAQTILSRLRCRQEELCFWSQAVPKQKGTLPQKVSVATAASQHFAQGAHSSGICRVMLPCAMLRCTGCPACHSQAAA